MKHAFISADRLVILSTRFRALLPGILLCVVVALSASFLSEHYGGPPLLYALLLGMAFNFISDDSRLLPGVNVCGRTALRAGVALMGLRITFDQVVVLGYGVVLMIIAAVAITIVSGLVLAKFMRRHSDEGLLSGCAVGICGASAALAVSAVLPSTPDNRRFTLLVVVGVTLLSTIAMILYPLALTMVGFPSADAGIFLGATIHDVAQVVAAGMILGNDAGQVAAIVKLFRVALLVPIVISISFFYVSRVHHGSQEVKLLAFPGFLLVFAAFVGLASFGLLNPALVEASQPVSRWLLIVAIAGIGIKTRMTELVNLGWQPVIMLVAETGVIALVVLGYFLVLTR